MTSRQKFSKLCGMNKEQAVEIFGSQARLAEAVGVTTSAVAQWKETLTERQSDRVIAALVRAGREVPQELLRQPAAPAPAAPAPQEAAA